MSGARSAHTETDRRLMAAALRYGRRHLGHTFPNPAVGALVVRFEEGEPVIVARGATAPGGRPHAERIALAAAGEAARGATLYVTLEPCAHQGVTPPCTEAVIAAGVGRVVTALEDPDPRVGGRGHAMIRDAGIPLVTGVLAEEARRAHAGHILRVTAGRPHITLKLAVSADGMIGRANSERLIVSGREAFDRVQAMRAESDAIMVGIGTALVDNPRLNVRLPGLAARSPVRVVLDSRARLPLSSLLVTTAREIPLWLVVGPEAPAESVSALEAAGVRILRVGGGSGGTDIEAVFRALGEAGITRILVEGGAKIASSLVAAGLADEVILIRAPVVIGADGVRALAGRALSAVERSPRFRLVEEYRLGEDRLLRYEKAV
ncbi:bifunctional diaminohydroxyphosphoribosylaminopyrimidine deaminase/5-amino-6-(5-phosphoribosylamino)uracil reductase RibD [Prosthecomicrobium pneumaticum]|uniref:Riboflavin biosynthesis protein RibD n=1 Tax=Prosthecomicrobium pneumaticum TaxID=81895 RepID=A0A7W9FQ06_9HYPH|nr:diaminohydroxyphosphoribosylaminopyrimidine deaminase/5-amino-6-(5-phosphoribosylamino)uracil reductase [Prosthecomicrobium pneumaticum]